MANLFSQSTIFSGVRAEQWKNKIKADLKGADYEQKCVWHSWDNLTVQPFYQKKDYVIDLHKSSAAPHCFSILRLLEPLHQVSPQQVETLISLGAQGLECTLMMENQSATFNTLLQFSKKLKFFILRINQELSSSQQTSLLSELKKRVAEDSNLNFKILLPQPNYELNTENISALGIDLLPYHAQGADAGLELGYAIAQAWEIGVSALQNNLDWKALLNSIHFHLGVGPHFFAEIAKLRSLRHLWNELVMQFAANSTNAALERDFPQPFIQACTSPFYQTDPDPYTNLLRATTEGLSALLGGATGLSILPYDWSTQSQNPAAQRFAVNIAHILKEEGLVLSYGDAVEGNYFISQLSLQLMQQAWETFERIEAAGGWSAYQKKGLVAAELQDLRQQRGLRLQNRQDTLLGVNKYSPKEADAVTSKALSGLSAELKEWSSQRLALLFQKEVS